MSSTGGTRVYVGNLTDQVKKEEIEAEFAKFGKLNSIWVAFNPPGFAFVEFSERADADAACDQLNGQELLGTKLRVEISKGRRQPPRGRFGGAVGGGFRAGPPNGQFRGRPGGFNDGYARRSFGAGGGIGGGPAPRFRSRSPQDDRRF